MAIIFKIIHAREWLKRIVILSAMSLANELANELININEN